MELTDYAQKVQQMRIAQHNYFSAARKGDKAGKDHWMPICKTMEKEVDLLTEQLLSSKNAKQSNLF